jgi:hypothetical protein
MIKFLKISIFILLSSLSFNAQEQKIEDYIKVESIDGKLDFKKQLIKEGKKNKLLIYEGVAYNFESYSILLWGKSVKSLGINSYKEAISLWKKIYKKELSKTHKKALKKGFKSK